MGINSVTNYLLCHLKLKLKLNQYNVSCFNGMVFILSNYNTYLDKSTSADEYNLKWTLYISPISEEIFQRKPNREWRADVITDQISRHSKHLRCYEGITSNWLDNKIHSIKYLVSACCKLCKLCCILLERHIIVWVIFCWCFYLYSQGI